VGAAVAAAAPPWGWHRKDGCSVAAEKSLSVPGRRLLLGVRRRWSDAGTGGHRLDVSVEVTSGRWRSVGGAKSMWTRDERSREEGRREASDERGACYVTG
jgi:hypothetical protein